MCRGLNVKYESFEIICRERKDEKTIVSTNLKPYVHLLTRILFDY